MAERQKYQFKSVKLLKEQSLGIGSYGAVCKAKCDDLLCAAKIIHPTLFDHTALQQISPHEEHRLPIRRFEQECEFMSAIRHPNIVQYLGMISDTDTRLPVLLMELMDDSLTHFLESSTQPIPYHIQVNVCHDVTLALSFLHSNNIVHRDLSSNNVLLISSTRAKVTDFGMARLSDINPQATRFTSTMCPGTDVYMPPEAVQNKPVYTEKIDCFSFGVIIIQILTRQFPNPGDRLQRIELNHPGLPVGSVLMEVAEINRRQNHISLIAPNHSLLPIALDCLKDKDSERPSAHQLCERIAHLKEMPKYRDSARSVQNRGADNSEVIQSQAARMEEKDCIISLKEEENQQLRQQLQQERGQANRQREEREKQLNQQLRHLQQESDQALSKIRTQLQERDRQLGHVNRQLEASEQAVVQFERQITELKLYGQLQVDKRHRQQQENDEVLRQKSRQIEEKDRQLGRVNQQLEASEQVVAQFEGRIAELEQQLNRKEPQMTQANVQITELEQQLSLKGQKTIKASCRGKEQTKFKLRWREGKGAPCQMIRYCDAVVDGNIVYIKTGASDSAEIYYYDVTGDSWSQLPKCAPKSTTGSLSIIDGWLTIVGGYFGGTYYNELFSLTGEGSVKKWTQKLPPMPTKRKSTTALCTGTTLVVAGGLGEGRAILSTVEVMSTETHQWFSAVDLPQPIYWASATVCGDQLYTLCGCYKDDAASKSVYTCSVSTLLQSCVPSSLGANLKRKSSGDKGKVWRRIADSPVTESTCTFFHDRLLAIGGSMDSGKSTTAVYMYDSTTNSWEIISHMTTNRCNCFTAVLPDNRLMVVGGRASDDYVSYITNTVEACVRD